MSCALPLYSPCSNNSCQHITLLYFIVQQRNNNKNQLHFMVVLFTETDNINEPDYLEFKDSLVSNLKAAQLWGGGSVNFWEFLPLFFLCQFEAWVCGHSPPPSKKARLITRAQVRSRWEICGITTVESLKTNCKCEWVLLLLLALEFVSGEMCWQLLRLFMC